MPDITSLVVFPPLQLELNLSQGANFPVTDRHTTHRWDTIVRTPTPVVDDEYLRPPYHWGGVIQSEACLPAARELELVTIACNFDGGDLTPIDAVGVCSCTRYYFCSMGRADVLTVNEV